MTKSNVFASLITSIMGGVKFFQVEIRAELRTFPFMDDGGETFFKSFSKSNLKVNHARALWVTYFQISEWEAGWKKT